MKHLNYILLGAAGLVLASCSQEDIVTGNGDGTANVSINLNVPQLATRSYSDGKTAVNLQYAVYKKNTETQELTWLDMNGTGTMENLQKQVNLKLVTNHTYGIVFWADSGTTPYSINFGANGATMSINYDETAGTPTANDERLDAFCAYHEIVVTGDATETVYLYRPFAQINVGTSDKADAKTAGYVPTVSHMKVTGIYDTLDLVTGAVSNSDNADPKTHDYSFAAIPEGETFPVSVPGHEYLTMVYALVPAEQQTVEVEFCTKDANDLHAAEHTVGSVPVQRNYRTNIYGQLLTSNVDVNVIIEPAYEDPDYLVNHDGVEYDAASQTYTITNAHGLAWVAQRVNSYDGKGSVSVATPDGIYGSPKCSFYGQKVVLANDIDMSDCGTRAGEVAFQPIGYKTTADGKSIYAFAGEFDGQNHTISNLYVSSEENNHAALFGYTHDATIKNVTLKDVNINGHYKVGGLVADAHCTNIENCKVSGGSITTTAWEIKPGVYDDGNNAGGIVGYYDVQPKQAYMKNNTVENVDIKAFRRIGGLAGYVGCRDDHNPHQCGIEVTGNVISNVNLTADMSETRYDKYSTRNPEIGELYGSNGVQDYANPKTVQTDGYSNVTKNIIQYNVDATVSSVAELKAALQEGKKTVVLAPGVYTDFDEQFYESKNQYMQYFTPETVLLGYGAVIKNVSTLKFNNDTNHTQLEGATIKGVTFDGFARSILMCGNFYDCTFQGGMSNHPADYQVYCENCNFIWDASKNNMAFHVGDMRGEGKVTLKDCNIDGRCDFGLYGGELTFDGCTLNFENTQWGVYYDTAEGAKVNFINCTLVNGNQQSVVDNSNNAVTISWN